MENDTEVLTKLSLQFIQERYLVSPQATINDHVKKINI